jgi:hypothetical protein
MAALAQVAVEAVVYSPAQVAQAVPAVLLAEVQMRAVVPQVGVELVVADGVHQAAALTMVVLLAVRLSH